MLQNAIRSIYCGTNLVGTSLYNCLKVIMALLSLVRLIIDLRNFGVTCINVLYYVLVGA